MQDLTWVKGAWLAHDDWLEVVARSREGTHKQPQLDDTEAQVIHAPFNGWRPVPRQC